MVASEILLPRRGGKLTRRSIWEYVGAVRARYMKASKKEKGAILMEFCQNTGYHRKSAIRLLRHPPGPLPSRRGRPRQYGSEVAKALGQVWEAGGEICSKRLKPFIRDLLSALERHGEIQLSAEVRGQLLCLSPASIDRLLGPARARGVRRPHTGSPSSSFLRGLIPVRTFGEWEGAQPGSFQVDLLVHCGESTEGFYLTTLVAVDVATGWSDCRVVWGKRQQRVGTAVHKVRQSLPFPMLELHSDNGGEFINHILYPWCMREGIRFTRGRSYKKNDQAYVEQKNWSMVRRLVGYDRYAGRAAYEEMERLYRPLRLYANFFQPVCKLKSKERVGSKVIKRYDEAKTPYQRLLETGVLGEDQAKALEQLYQNLNPVQLRAEIDSGLERLWKLAARPGAITTEDEAMREVLACG